MNEGRGGDVDGSGVDFWEEDEGKRKKKMRKIHEQKARKSGLGGESSGGRGLEKNQ